MGQELRGPFVVLVTPLDSERNQDTESLGRLVDYYLESGIRGLTILGESSEIEKLSAKEKEENSEVVMERCRDKVPVVVGTSHEGVQQAKDESLAAEEKGAAAVMVAPPKNPKLRDDKILDFYSTIGDAIRIPIILQDYPETGRPYLSPQLIARIAKEVPRVEYLKLEDPPTPMKLSKVIDATQSKLKIFGALGGRGYFWELERGSVGVMTASPTPEYLVGIWERFESNDRDAAKEIFFDSLPLVHAYSEMGLSVRKEVLVQRKVIKTANMKQPAAELDDKARAEVRDLLRWTEKTILDSVGIRPLR